MLVNRFMINCFKGVVCEVTEVQSSSSKHLCHTSGGLMLQNTLKEVCVYYIN